MAPSSTARCELASPTFWQLALGELFSVAIFLSLFPSHHILLNCSLHKTRLHYTTLYYHSVQGAASGASHDANKEQAKNSNASLGDRASAGVNAVSDKIDQKSHDAKAEAHKETAKN
ncbi:BQ2448_7651 [Microbotryum intermedium]|uniref:BQ2448_7651 protein n=1 Tax=Microbotryum intermedium TaxID=269621 RepID=A0A238FLH2_9BASI|nr:BQ2448_7651 [Microbotryum intermedium]